MKLTVLTENTAGGRFGAEHGLSYLIEHDGKTILFDTGHSDLFLSNAVKLGYDLEKHVDVIVLSHGHWDHGDGLRYIENKPLITHPLSFIKRYRKADHSYIGLAFNKEETEKRFELFASAGPHKITDSIIFLGAIPRENDFEAKNTTFIDENGNEDFVPDDSAMVFILNKEIVVVTACSHSGICNITEYARKVTGIKKVKAVIGGFHLKKDDRQTRETVKYFKKIGVEQVHPSHCTELPALTVFFNEFGIEQVKTGKQYTF
jgi:7,8-dihydropterin-6-yl-methyl-4-(beta-D-ribofuranosyl)aminobenzene 5'-phosphate synthase